MRVIAIRYLLLILCIGMAILSYTGAIILFCDPTGKGLDISNLLPSLRALPFARIFMHDFIFVGIALLISLGLSNTITAIFLYKEAEKAYQLTMVCGFILLLWSAVMIFIFDFSWIPNTLFGIGVGQLFLGFLLVNERKE